MLKVLIKPYAKSDIKKIWSYTYKNWGEKQAYTYCNSLSQTISVIPENPKIGNSIDHVREGYRSYHFKQHLIIYSVSTTEINIVRVLSDNMDICRHL